MIQINELLEKHRIHSNRFTPKKLTFIGVGDKDVYNITASFTFNDHELLAGRIESRHDEQSVIGFFEEEKENIWVMVPDAICLPLQDPFVTFIDNQLIIGGVEVHFEESKAHWRTVFYRLITISEVEKVFTGPWGMKDLRIKQLNNGQILVLTRPQGDKGGRGKMGACIVDHLGQLTIKAIDHAPLLENQFSDEEWGGANEIHCIDDKVFVLGHAAKFDDFGNRHYYALTFELKVPSFEIRSPKIIAERKDFAEGPAKREDLYDVVFSGGIEIKDDEAMLFAGISDAGAQKIKIENPFR
ncbi:hypothetical protein A5886_000554 [Enterococcus sp. 8G7_MSG3316]|uniref:DUF1861 family protein n=1 Tax=Candidatus Enterococcus testudinis TaxID=1834191 RepID=A0A242A385_9ENTE|nr:DUF1861 family protein [Enterococcus sp. 8G7_MSG3316]OTN75484.1 hypothetical protein A5886_000554 [Enterococcus sp. 8G7_MSG3316]